MQIAIYVFPIANLMTSIPVFSILIRYNLLNSGICKKAMANVLAVVLPWVMALFFYAGNQLNYLIEWSSAVFFVLLNMSIPLYMYVVQYRRIGRHYDTANRPWQSTAWDADNNTALLPLDDDDDFDTSLAAPPIALRPVALHSSDSEADYALPDTVSVLPAWVRHNVISEIKLAYVLLLFTLVLACGTLAEQFQTI